MHLIEVLYDEVAVPKSPFRVSVVEGCDPTRVRAYGPGLEGGVTNKSNCFTVETRYCWITQLYSMCRFMLASYIINYLVSQGGWHRRPWPDHRRSLGGKNILQR